MRRLRAALAGVVLCAVPGATLLAAPPASALSCAVPAAAAMEAEHVFAGTIVERRADHLVMAVSEVWWGDAVVERVQLPLFRGMGVWYPWGTDDRRPGDHTWVVATRDDFKVGPCSIWPARSVRSLRPATPAQPVRGAAGQLGGTSPDAPLPTPSTASDPDLTTGRVWAANARSVALLGASLW